MFKRDVRQAEHTNKKRELRDMAREDRVGTRVYLRVDEAGKGLVWRVLWPVRYHQRGTSRGTGSGKAYNLLARPYAHSNITKRPPRWAVWGRCRGHKI